MPGAPDYALWSAEFILEATAAWLALRRHRDIRILWIYLGFRALADLANFLIFALFPLSTDFYWYSNYTQKTLQFVLLGILAMWCCGAATGEKLERVRPYAAVALVLVAAAIVIGHVGQQWSVPYLLTLGMRMDAALGVLVGGALLLREMDVMRARMAQPWPMISAALLVAVSSDGIVSLVRAQHLITMTAASRLLAVGQIVALGLFAITAARKERGMSMKCAYVGTVRTGSEDGELGLVQMVQCDKDAEEGGKYCSFHRYELRKQALKLAASAASDETLTRDEAETRWPGSTRVVN